MAHQDLWDTKPDAPAEIRGDFQPINTVVPGLSVSNILPHVAGVTDSLAILRGLTHSDPDHTAGYHVMMTGAHPGTGGSFNRSKHDNNVHPCLGSMVAKVGGGNGSLPPYISVPNFINSGGPAFLGASYAPFVIESDPASPEFSVRDIVLPEGVASDRSVRRQQALRDVNRFERDIERISKNVQAVDIFQEKAYNLMTSQRAKEAFDISRENDATRQSYGMTSLGQCCLLGRRLVAPQEHDEPSRFARAQSRPGAGGAFDRLETARTARFDAGGGDDRVWPHAADQCHGRTRPLAAGVFDRDGRCGAQDGPCDRRHRLAGGIRRRSPGDAP